MKKPETNDLLLGTITAVVILSISILIGKSIEVFEFRTVSIGVGIFIVVVLGIVGLAHIIQRSSYQEEITSLVDKLREIIPPTQFEWLYSDADLMKIESEVKGKDVWIVSPDFRHDLIKADFQDLTRENFKRGIVYTYIVPKSEAMDALIPMLREVYAPFLKQIRIRQVAEESFRLLAVTHIDIYDPNRSIKEGGARVFLELPITQRGYWVEVSQDAALNLIGRFRKIAEGGN